MKTKYALLICLFMLTASVNATTSLRIQNPHQTWHNYQGNIDTAVLSIKPKGAYFECGLYLTFSARPYNQNAYDTFEVQMPFDLPEGSFIHDSWLWVGNQIVQAKMYERNRAQMIYEGIVQRRQDPSILYKNGANQYELRVYPMPGLQQRKVKITYMVPATWGLNNVSCPLPLNIFKASKLNPYFEILSYTDSVWSNPVITEINTVLFSPVAGEDYTKAIIPSPYISSLGDLNYSLNSPMQNGLFTAIYPTDTNEGYYQMVVLPSQAMALSGTKKTAFLFDHELGNSTALPSEFISKTRQILLDNYSPADSFNLLFSQLGVYQYSPVWLSCDTGTINQVFDYLQQHNPVSTYSNLPSLLQSSINFIQSHGNSGNMILFTNTDNFTSLTAANQLITDVANLMGTNRIPIHIADLQDKNLSSTWNNNYYYYGGEYLYSNLSAITGGNYESIRERYSNSYYSYFLRSFSETVNDLINQMTGRISSFDAHTDLSNGFCFSNFDNSDGGVAFLNKPYIKIGRYSGALPLNVEISGIYLGQPVSQSFTMNNYFNADSFTRKMWVANFISEMESQTSINNQTKADIIDFSMHNRVLSLYTAFLALEPSDTTTTCNDCEDETNTGTTSISNNIPGTISLAAYPNPFSSAVTLKIHLEEPSATLKIYNTLGQLVKTFEINSDNGNDQELNWNGHDDDGNETTSGIYLVVLETSAGKKIIRIVKS